MNDLTGKKFGKLTVQGQAGRFGRYRHIYWNCLCDCGSPLKAVDGGNLVSGNVKSCGCIRVLHPNRTTHGKSRTPEYFMFIGARSRAREQNLPFNLVLEDIVIPAVCPLLEIPLVVAKNCHTDNSPSLDRICPEKGYVKGNIMVISFRANTIKSDATLSELKQLIKNWRIE